jgi:hypothetical protein
MRTEEAIKFIHEIVPILNNRQIGSTYIGHNGVKSNKDARYISNVKNNNPDIKTLTTRQVINGKLRGTGSPVALDHTVLAEILSLLLDELNKKERIIQNLEINEELNYTVQEIERRILAGERVLVATRSMELVDTIYELLWGKTSLESTMLDEKPEDRPCQIMYQPTIIRKGKNMEVIKLPEYL